MTRSRLRQIPFGPILLLVVVVVVLAACQGLVPGSSPGASHAVTPSPTPHPPLTPAQPGADPISFLAWAFTPIFQAMFIVLVAFYDLFTAIGLPAGLFIYWITATIFGIVQQYLIVGWGGMFPLFGRTPAFAVGHTPRFPVSMPPPPDPSKRSAILTDADKKTTATKTIRPRERGRQGRRGRRR